MSSRTVRAFLRAQAGKSSSGQYCPCIRAMPCRTQYKNPYKTKRVHQELERMRPSPASKTRRIIIQQAYCSPGGGRLDRSQGVYAAEVGVIALFSAGMSFLPDRQAMLFTCYRITTRGFIWSLTGSNRDVMEAIRAEMKLRRQSEDRPQEQQKIHLNRAGQFHTSRFAPLREGGI